MGKAPPSMLTSVGWRLTRCRWAPPKRAWWLYHVLCRVLYRMLYYDRYLTWDDYFMGVALLSAAEGEWPMLAVAAGPPAALEASQGGESALEAASGAPAALRRRLGAVAGPLAEMEPDLVLVRFVPKHKVAACPPVRLARVCWLVV
jgi:hypothetical protein